MAWINELLADFGDEGVKWLARASGQAAARNLDKLPPNLREWVERNPHKIQGLRAIRFLIPNKSIGHRLANEFASDFASTFISTLHSAPTTEAPKERDAKDKIATEIADDGLLIVELAMAADALPKAVQDRFWFFFDNLGEEDLKKFRRLAKAQRKELGKLVAKTDRELSLMLARMPAEKEAAKKETPRLIDLLAAMNTDPDLKTKVTNLIATLKLNKKPRVFWNAVKVQLGKSIRTLDDFQVLAGSDEATARVLLELVQSDEVAGRTRRAVKTVKKTLTGARDTIEKETRGKGAEAWSRGLLEKMKRAAAPEGGAPVIVAETEEGAD